MFSSQKMINITLKLYAGLDRELELENYDSAAGLSLAVKNGLRLRGVLKMIGMKNLGKRTYYLNGMRISIWRKLRDGDDISCLKPSGGG